MSIHISLSSISQTAGQVINKCQTLDNQLNVLSFAGSILPFWNDFSK
jgi:hypothetical protein